MRQLPLIATLCVLAMPAFADDSALLLGVERYDDLRRVSGGTDVLNAADELRDAGYDVSTLANGSARDMNRCLNALPPMRSGQIVWSWVCRANS